MRRAAAVALLALVSCGTTPRGKCVTDCPPPVFCSDHHVRFLVGPRQNPGDSCEVSLEQACGHTVGYECRLPCFAQTPFNESQCKDPQGPRRCEEQVCGEFAPDSGRPDAGDSGVADGNLEDDGGEQDASSSTDAGRRD